MSKRPPPVPGRKPGRPPGRGDTDLLRASLIDPHLPEIIAKLLDLMRAGDVSAAKALLDRGIASLKAHAAPVALDLPAGALVDQAKGLMAAALAGNVPPDVAAGLIQALGLIDTLEQSELLRREMAEYA